VTAAMRTRVVVVAAQRSWAQRWQSWAVSTAFTSTPTPLCRTRSRMPRVQFHNVLVLYVAGWSHPCSGPSNAGEPLRLSISLLPHSPVFQLQARSPRLLLLLCRSAPLWHVSLPPPLHRRHSGGQAPFQPSLNQHRHQAGRGHGHGRAGQLASGRCPAGPPPSTSQRCPWWCRSWHAAAIRTADRCPRPRRRASAAAARATCARVAAAKAVPCCGLSWLRSAAHDVVSNAFCCLFVTRIGVAHQTSLGRQARAPTALRPPQNLSRPPVDLVHKIFLL